MYHTQLSARSETVIENWHLKITFYIMPSPVNLSLSFLSHMSRNLMDFIAIQKQSLCLFPPVSIHGQSHILTDLITILARLPSQPNTHFQDCGKGHYLVGVKATTRVGSMPLQREFINFNSGIERNALNEKESSIWTIYFWLVDLLVADIQSSGYVIN